VRKNVWIPIISGVYLTDNPSFKELWIQYVAVVNPDQIEEINTSVTPLPADVEAKIAGTSVTGECF
jgi:hypothetical protein